MGQTKYFLSKRDEFNQYVLNSILTTGSALLFIFLNKAGYNEPYRVNKKGVFNVSSAHRRTLKIFDIGIYLAISQALQKCSIKCSDFEDARGNTNSGDFIFFDSPYYDTFDTYQTGGFLKNDHVRLAQFLKNFQKEVLIVWKQTAIANL